MLCLKAISGIRRTSFFSPNVQLLKIKSLRVKYPLLKRKVYTVCGECKLVLPLWKSYKPDINMLVFVAAPLTIAKIENQPRCPTTVRKYGVNKSN
jgi:hypothetical protein